MNDAEFRRAHVGAAEVAALFDCHPNLTRFELWHRKAGNIDEPDLDRDERVRWGQMLEPTIIAELCRREGWTRDRARLKASNGRGLGGHRDASIICPERGRGILETKNVDWLVARDWGDEPPLHYLLQLQTYQGLWRRSWGALGALIGGNDLVAWPYAFRPGLFAKIEQRVDEFWLSIREGREPKPDFSADSDTIRHLYADASGQPIDMSTDNYAGELARRFLDGKAKEAEGKAEADAARAEMLTKIGDAPAVTLSDFFINAGRVRDWPGHLITAEQVGTYVGGRRGYRRFEIKEAQNG